MKRFSKDFSRRWVVKLGTGILTDSRGQLDLAQMARLARQVGWLHQKGHQIILVTSGAIGAGMGILGLKKRPKEIEMLQTCAAIGQPHLMSVYQELFALEKLDVAQLLFTYLDIDSRSMHANACKTLARLLELKSFVPIVNENDVVANEEIKFGDNDRLSAHVALMVRAGRLVILSNVPGLMSHSDGTGLIIPKVKKIDSKIEALAGKTQSQTSVGGMASKIMAARMATEAGIPLHIAHGRDPEILVKMAQGKKVGTVFLP